MDAESKSADPTPAAAAASAASISAVLGDDDLLREILLRLGFPTCLVRAALVSRRWLRHASDPAFLRRFRRLHPPRLLGFYVSYWEFPHPQFVPVSQAPELATAIRCASFPNEGIVLMDCRNGRRLVRFVDGIFYPFAVLSLLQPTRGMALFPPPPNLCFCFEGIFLPELRKWYI